MSFTEEGFNRVISGEFPDKVLSGRLGIELISISQKRIKMKFFVAALEDNEVLFEYAPTAMKVGQQVLLNGAEARIPIEIVTE